MARDYDESYYGKDFGKVFGGRYKKKSDTSEILQFNLEGMNQPPIDVTDIRQVVDRASLYFERCAEKDIDPGVASMCVWIGVPRTRWLKWCNGQEFPHTHQQACLKIAGVLDAMNEHSMQKGKINPVTGIYIAKNNFQGYSDNPQPETETKTSPIIERSMSDILKLASPKKKKKE